MQPCVHLFSHGWPRWSYPPPHGAHGQRRRIGPRMPGRFSTMDGGREHAPRSKARPSQRPIAHLHTGSFLELAGGRRRGHAHKHGGWGHAPGGRVWRPQRHSAPTSSMKNHNKREPTARRGPSWRALDSPGHKPRFGWTRCGPTTAPRFFWARLKLLFLTMATSPSRPEINSATPSKATERFCPRKRPRTHPREKKPSEKGHGHRLPKRGQGIEKSANPTAKGYIYCIHPGICHHARGNCLLHRTLERACTYVNRTRARRLRR